MDNDRRALEIESNKSGDDGETNGLQKDCSTDGKPSGHVCKKVLELTSIVEVLKKHHSMIASKVENLTTELVTDSELYDKIRLFGVEYEQSKNKCMLLEKNYLLEAAKRKRLYNEVFELKGNIRVFCRCRSLRPSEADNGSTAVIEFDSLPDNELQVICSDSSKKQFKFDHVFKPEDSQESVFSQTAPVVTSVMDGYNVCIFAYGQTGTGKTFTMEGTSENRGVNYRTLEELFRLSNETRGIMSYELSVSMLEVYNEKIRDLLVENLNEPTKKLEIKQTPEGTQDVPGLTEARVDSTDKVWELLMKGSRARSVGSTNANELSSRSHCLLRVTVKGENLVNGQQTRSHLWLVDLAGSERLGKIEVEGERLKESQFINKSLSALGDVISALASKSSHVPYRNSKLTHLLQSSLGGDCKTLVFVQVSPSASRLGETLCSLNFASRLRGVEAGPARKQADTSELFKYKQLAEKQNHDEKELKKLQDIVQSLQLRLAARQHICRGFQDKVRELESQLAEERKTRLKQEIRTFAAVSASYAAGMVVKKNSEFDLVVEDESNDRYLVSEVSDGVCSADVVKKNSEFDLVEEDESNDRYLVSEVSDGVCSADRCVMDTSASTAPDVYSVVELTPASKKMTNVLENLEDVRAKCVEADIVAEHIKYALRRIQRADGIDNKSRKLVDILTKTVIEEFYGIPEETDMLSKIVKAKTRIVATCLVLWMICTLVAVM